MTKLINMTPHAITIVKKDGEKIMEIPASGKTIRLKTSTESAGFAIEDIPVTKTTFGEPEGLPDFEDGTFFIVSQLIKNAFPTRNDLLVPAEVVRNAEGNIVGCTSLGI